ncbi:hypothetical protein SCUCBS95973_002308 [Sporothrix curviconia]|uniref:Protein kinase domain-containing protein n=1 Tax=Sporothrix curviconia TaxID=1260050 RepID=A0ABP0B5Z3_9PEZI
MEDLSSTQIAEHELSLGDKLKIEPLITATGRIELSACGSRVTKSIIKEMPEFWRSIQRKQLRREIDTYRHLPVHPRLVPVLDFGQDGDDAFLAIKYMPNRTLAAYLKQNEAAITAELRTRWIRQTAEGVALLHAHNVIHADLKPTNLLLDADLNVRIADFGGCSLLGQRPYILESGPFYLPAAWREKDALGCSVATDIFGLGSCIFQIVPGKQPYDDMEDGDIETKFTNQEFPSLDGVLCADVVSRCWQSELASAESVLDALTLEETKK